MTPERMADVVARWVRLYTRNLPEAVTRRRIGEIEADLHDHIAHERADGAADGHIARSIAARMVRGLGADVSWREAVTRSTTRKEPMHDRRSITRSIGRVALVTALVLLVPLVWMQFDSEVDWSVFDFSVAAILLATGGLLIELALRRPRTLLFRGAAVALGGAAMVLGEADDAPGLVLFGLLLIGGAVALTVRTLRA
jgi:hypothetical protein